MRLYSTELINYVKNKINNLEWDKIFTNKDKNTNKKNMKLIEGYGVEPSVLLAACWNNKNMELADFMIKRGVDIRNSLRALIGINLKISKFVGKYIFDKKIIDLLNDFVKGVKDSSTVLKHIEGYNKKFNIFLYEQIGREGIENLEALIDAACSENSVASKIYQGLKVIHNLDINKITETLDTGSKVNKNIFEWSENFEKQLKRSFDNALKKAIDAHKWELASFIISKGGDKRLAIDAIEKELPVDEFGIIVKCGIMLPKEASELSQKAIKAGRLKLNEKGELCKVEKVNKIHNNRKKIDLISIENKREKTPKSIDTRICDGR